MEKERRQQIKLRVCVVLQYWVGNQFFDFDDELVRKIFDFVDNTLKKDGNTELAVLLSRAIGSRVRNKF